MSQTMFRLRVTLKLFPSLLSSFPSFRSSFPSFLPFSFPFSFFPSFLLTFQLKPETLSKLSLESVACKMIHESLVFQPHVTVVRYDGSPFIDYVR